MWTRRPSVSKERLATSSAISSERAERPGKAECQQRTVPLAGEAVGQCDEHGGDPLGRCGCLLRGPSADLAAGAAQHDANGLAAGRWLEAGQGVGISDGGDPAAKRRGAEAGVGLVGDSLEAVRAMLPPGLERIERTPFMPEGVVEAWD